MTDIRKEIDKHGRIYYYNANNELHNETGPAIIETNGDKQWFIHDKHHRIDGPAVISQDYKSWWINGRLHRNDGPAQEWSDGSTYWYLNGIDLTDEINKWMAENNISYPFSKEHLTLFQLTWA